MKMVNLTKRFYCKFGIGVLYTEVFAFSPKVTVKQVSPFEKLISYRYARVQSKLPTKCRPSGPLLTHTRPLDAGPHAQQHAVHTHGSGRPRYVPPAASLTPHHPSDKGSKRPKGREMLGTSKTNTPSRPSPRRPHVAARTSTTSIVEPAAGGQLSRYVRSPRAPFLPAGGPVHGRGTHSVSRTKKKRMRRPPAREPTASARAHAAKPMRCRSVPL